MKHGEKITIFVLHSWIAGHLRMFFPCTWYDRICWQQISKLRPRQTFKQTALETFNKTHPVHLPVASQDHALQREYPVSHERSKREARLDCVDCPLSFFEVSRRIGILYLFVRHEQSSTSSELTRQTHIQHIECRLETVQGGLD